MRKTAEGNGRRRMRTDKPQKEEKNNARPLVSQQGREEVKEEGAVVTYAWGM